ncbi:hypothetical protein [Paraburkholderia phytofirmans]|jgi:hypothetical protein|nr:hypothetical protein [Paraburkholderia phytofirmans]
MDKIQRHLGTALAFIAGETLVCLMLLTALVCKLTERIGKSRPPR